MSWEFAEKLEADVCVIVCGAGGGGLDIGGGIGIDGDECPAARIAACIAKFWPMPFVDGKFGWDAGGGNILELLLSEIRGGAGGGGGGNVDGGVEDTDAETWKPEDLRGPGCVTGGFFPTGGGGPFAEKGRNVVFVTVFLKLDADKPKVGETTPFWLLGLDVTPVNGLVAGWGNFWDENWDDSVSEV